MGRVLARLLPLALWAAPACAPASAELAVLVAPSPVLITGFNFGHGMIVDQASWFVQATETAGLGGIVESVTSQMRDPRTGDVVGEVTPPSFTGRLEGHGSLTVEQRWGAPRDITNAFQPRVLHVTVAFRDEAGHRIERRIEVATTYQ